MKTRTIELAGGIHLQLAVVDGDPHRPPVLALTRSSEEGGIGSMLQPERPQVVVPATCIPELVDALEELEGST